MDLRRVSISCSRLSALAVDFAGPEEPAGPERPEPGLVPEGCFWSMKIATRAG
ncbi:hypothetical protein JCM14635_26290 [Megalodesulfovibrio paquesii]